MARRAKSDPRLFVALDIGGSKTLAVAFDERFRPVGRARRETAGHLPPDKLFARVCSVATDCLRAAGAGPRQLAGVGAGVAGQTDPAAGAVVFASHLSWRNFPLADRLARRFGVPAVVDNDCNLGALGECHFGAGRGSRHLVGLFYGTGVGGGLVLDGRLHHGASGAAGEIGHVVLDPGGPRCGCGRRGCLQAYVGRWAVAGELAGLALRGQAPHLARRAGGDLAAVTAQAIAAAIDAGDTLVEEAIRLAGRRIGVACASLVNVLSPDRIVLGGGMMQALGPLVLAEVRSAVRDHAMPFLAQPVRIVPAKLGDDATVYGAARLIADRVAGQSGTV